MVAQQDLADPRGHTTATTSMAGTPLRDRLWEVAEASVEPFQLMMTAKELPMVEFADYTFVFPH